MSFDEIVIGSGLTALAVVLGLPANRRVLVIGGPANGQFVYYDESEKKPCAYVGHGGLGNYWHGGIVLRGEQSSAGARSECFETLFRRFYSHAPISGQSLTPCLFVPWQPIRPKVEWLRIKAERSDRLVLSNEIVSRFELGDGPVSVQTDRSTHVGQRLWLCAGALHTPGLLNRSFDQPLCRRFASDHIFCQLGQIDRSRTRTVPHRVQRTKDGILFECRHDDKSRALYRLRPARFEFAQLDRGIEHRSKCGTPTGKPIRDLARMVSLGLFAESLYNHFGLFPNARMQSIYAQIDVPDAHEFCSGGPRLSSRHDVIKASIDVIRANLPWEGTQLSRRPDLYIPGTHLHHSVNLDALSDVEVNGPASRVQIADASVMHDIGPDHHSFNMMVAAYEQARLLTRV